MDFSPSIAQSLEFIQKYDKEDLEEVLCGRFAIDVDRYGEKISMELVPGGENIPVTQKNKHEYIAKYLDWLFNKSIFDVFEAFKRGFYKLYSGEFTQNCEPEELELLICGSPNLDFKELENNTQYEGGYSKDSPIIKYSIIKFIEKH